jgi:hypothetical protein
MDVGLRKNLPADAKILLDQTIPGTRSKIDHIVVAPSGVWIIDSKVWKGKIEYKAKSLSSTEYQLFVDGIDRTSKVEAIYNLVIPVAQLIDDHEVQVHSAIVFIDGDWSAAQSLRIVRDKPHQHLGVWITWPRALYKMISAPGPLDASDITRVYQRLESGLKPWSIR